MNAVLVTGTDTDVGKTWVSRALCAALAATGRRVVAIKPVETGCEEAGRESEDGVLLAAATGQAAPREALYRFASPLTPVLAAEADGADPVDLDALLLRIEGFAADADVLLMEGAGGLLAPITWEWNVVELARSLGATALLVGPDRLGVINHALLALGALELAGIEVAGMILTPPAVPDASTGTNAAAIERLGGLDRVIAVPREPDPVRAAESVAPAVEWLHRPRVVS